MKATFVNQLRNLDKELNQTYPRFIRCIKPNQQKKPMVFDAKSSLDQMRFAGVFEARGSRREGFLSRSARFLSGPLGF